MEDVLTHTCGGALRHLMHVCCAAACAAAPPPHCCLQAPLPQPSFAARQLSGSPSWGLLLEAQLDAHAAPELAGRSASMVSSSVSSKPQSLLMLTESVLQVRTATGPLQNLLLCAGVHVAWLPATYSDVQRSFCAQFVFAHSLNTFGKLQIFSTHVLGPHRRAAPARRRPFGRCSWPKCAEPGCRAFAMLSLVR